MEKSSITTPAYQIILHRGDFPSLLEKNVFITMNLSFTLPCEKTPHSVPESLELKHEGNKQRSRSVSRAHLWLESAQKLLPNRSIRGLISLDTGLAGKMVPDI